MPLELTLSLETPTLSVTLSPVDKRCTWFCKVDPSGLARTPDPVEGATSLPGDRVRAGTDLELPAWSVVYDVEARHHAKMRGWDHRVGIVVLREDGGLSLRWVQPTAAHKAAIKAADPSLRGGSGPNAAMVRLAAYVLRGETEADRLARWLAMAAIT
jgi:hypothetical protein